MRQPVYNCIKVCTKMKPKLDSIAKDMNDVIFLSVDFEKVIPLHLIRNIKKSKRNMINRTIVCF